MLLAPSLPAFLMHCHYTCMLLPRRRCLDRRALQTSCPRPNARSRRQAEPAPRSWAHLRDRAQPGHIKVRFLFRAREHIPACLDMRAPSVHHMLHAEHPHARAHARTASRSIALSARGRSLMLPSHLAGHYSASLWSQTIMPAAFNTYCSSCTSWCFLFFPDRAQCSPFLSRRVSEAVAGGWTRGPVRAM